MDLKSISEPFALIGMKVGSDHTKCPTGTHSGSDSVSCKQVDGGNIAWYCHACGSGGSIVDAWASFYGMSIADAMSELEKNYSDASFSGQQAAIFKLEEERDNIYPTTEGIPSPQNLNLRFRNSDDKMLHIKDATVWIAPYEDEEGELWACGVARWDYDDKKVVRQMHYHGGKWSLVGAPHKSRPLYKWSELNNAELIIVVEGEKCMDVTQAACDKAKQEYEETFPNVVVTTIVGGSKAVGKAVLEPLRRKPVLLVRDNDKPGLVMMKYIKDFISRPGTKIINLATEDKEAGYDIADWLAEGNDIRKVIVMDGEDVDDDESGSQNEKKKKVYTAEELERMAKDLTDQDIGDKAEEFFRVMANSRPNALWAEKILTQAVNSLRGSKRAINNMYKEAIQQRDAEENLTSDWPLLVATKTFNELYGKRLIYRGLAFWEYTGTHWKIVDKTMIEQNLLRVASRIVPDEKRDTASIITKGSTIIRALSAVDGDYLGLTQDPKSIINVKNGELHINMKTGEVKLRPHSPDSRLTYCLDIEYDPEAECPNYDKMMMKVMCNDEDLLRHFEECAGYMIQPVRNHKNFFMFYGQKGNNGKTVVKNIITQLIGNDNILGIKIDAFGSGQHDTAGLVGKMMVVDDDVDKGIKLNDGLIKQISEKKTLSANPKNKDIYTFVSYAVVLMATNHFPRTTDLTKAMVNRAMIIPFNAFFSDKDPDFDRDIESKISKEMSGVLNRFLAGLQRLRMRNTWDVPKACRDVKIEWLLSTSNLFTFTSMNIEESNDQEDKIYAKHLRERYIKWAEDLGIQERHQINLRSMRNGLSELGYETANANNNMGGWSVIGATLKDYDEDSVI